MERPAVGWGISVMREPSTAVIRSRGSSIAGQAVQAPRSPRVLPRVALLLRPMLPSGKSSAGSGETKVAELNCSA